MTTTTCPFCANDIASNVANCPVCGGAIPQASVPAQPAAQSLQPQQAVMFSSSARQGKTTLVIALLVVVLTVGGVVVALLLSETSSSGGTSPPVPGAVNQPIRGNITRSNPNRVYEFQITQSGPVSLSLTSDFDNFLELYGNDPDRPLQSDDDSGEGLNARLERTLAPGIYYALVRAYSEGTGPFLLRINAPLEATQPSGAGQPTGTTPPPSPTAEPPLTDAGARIMADEFYRTRSEWAGQYRISITNTRLDPNGPDAVAFHTQYLYTCIQSRCAGGRTGQDQRIFYFQRLNGRWQVVQMGGHMSASF